MVSPRVKAVSVLVSVMSISTWLTGTRADAALLDMLPAPAVGVIFQWSGKCLNVPGSSQTPVAMIQYSTCGSGLNDNFDFVPTGEARRADGAYPTYWVKSTHVPSRNQCLDVEASGSADGTRILQY